MYRVLCDGLPIFDPRDDDLVLIDPKLVLELNSAGSFTFKMSPNHPQYDLPVKMKSCIQVFQDGYELFNGRPIVQKTDFYNRKYLECEGQLAFLNDSIQRPAEYHDMTVRGYLETLIAYHNEQVKEDKQFEVGIVTVKDSNDSLYRYTNYNSTMKEIKEDLIDDLGGYIRVRNENGHRYLDYLTIDDYGSLNPQAIEFGENLLDFTRNLDVTDIATAIIPLGAKLEDSPIAALEQRLTIESVNNGADYLFSQEAVDAYGWIFKTVTWDDVTTAEMLKSKGQKYLSDYQFENMTIEAKAVDLHCTDEEIEAFRLGDRIRVLSAPHALDRYFPLSKLTIYLNKLSNNPITLGNASDISLSAKTNSTSSSISSVAETIPVPSAIVNQAIEQATALITAATHGHVVTTAEEQLIMDTDDVNTARKVWRWNLNGLGYSNTGYNGTYATAITMDGQIVGERLVGGSVSAEKLSVEYTTQVTKEIADAEKTARSDAEDYTDAKLKDYYTISQITTAIKNTADSVLLSAKETAVEYVDGRLQNYSTSADIKVTTDAITSEVSKKLNSSDFTTKLTQNYKYVRIAWNSCTKYIQFEGAALNVYDNSEQLLMSLTYTGARYYYQGTSIGRIGTNSWSSDTSYRGLVFDLEYDASYMCWAAKDSSSATSYTTKLIYHHKNTKDKQGLHFACNTYADGNLYLTDDYRFLVWSSGGCGFNGKMTWCNKANSNAVVIDGVNKQFAIYNNVDIDFYAALDMHNYSINNQSDARMKKNIADTQVEALKMLNAIDLKEFDWVQTGGHENIGIIAQQLALFAPELVNEEADGHLSIKTTKFIFYLIKAVQELSKGLGYEKVAWEDPYTLLEKKSFCALLSAEIATDEEAVKEPIQIPIRKG